MFIAGPQVRYTWLSQLRLGWLKSAQLRYIAEIMLRWILLLICIFSTVWWLTGAGTGDSVAIARAFYESQPAYLRPRLDTEIPAGLPDLSAATCGACHPDIYAEWQISTHARAMFDDAQFQAELEKSRHQNGHDTAWTCVNCHTPLLDQLEKLVVDLEDGHRGHPVYVPNPNFDPKLQKEAITCATCHVRDGVVLGPFGDTDAPHATRRAPELLSPDVCLQCHQQVRQLEDIRLACLFDTGTEWQGRPEKHADKTCQTCHMPEIERKMAVQSKTTRKTRRHWFGGSLIAKHPKYAAEIAELEAHYPDGMTAGWSDLPSSVEQDKLVTLTYFAENSEAGHRLPTGDPERFITLVARVLDDKGEVIAEDSQRFGIVYNWQELTKVEDTRLGPSERRPFSLMFTARTSQVTLELVATKHRLSAEVVAFHKLEGQVVPQREFLSERVELPVR